MSQPQHVFAPQNRHSRIALAGAEVSKALADMVGGIGTPQHEQHCQMLAYSLADYLVATRRSQD